MTAGALPPVAPAVTPPTPAESGGNAAVGPAGHHVADESGRPAWLQSAELPAVATRQPLSSVTHDPDRVITDWYDREPDPRTPLRYVIGWLVLAAALWALLILVGYDVWHLLGLRMPWAA